MTQAAKEWIDAHAAKSDLLWAAREAERRVAQLKIDLDQSIDQKKRKKKLDAAAGVRPRGRPENTELEDRITSLRRQLALAEEDLEAAKAAVPLVEQRLANAFPTQQNINRLADDDSADRGKFCSLLTDAQGICQRWVRRRAEIASLAGPDVTVPESVTVGPSVIETFERCAAEIVDVLSGAAEQRRRAAIEAQQAEQAEREAEIAAGVNQLKAAAEKLADVPAVRFKRAVLDSAVARFHSTPKRAPDGSPNAGGDGNNPGRLATWNAAGAAHAEYWHIVAKAAGLEERSEFIPPMPDLGPMY